jgi:lipoprotein signal peptidase
VFWIKFLLIVITVFALISIIKLILRKVLHLKKVKRKVFSYNLINERHREIDKWIRLVSVITLIGLSWGVIEDKSNMFLYVIGMTILLMVDYLVRAYFEWKHSEYPKQAILTMAEMLIMVTAIFTVLQMGLLGF